MASSHDFSTLSWDEVLSKLREVENLCAKCALKQETLFARYNSLPDNSSAKSRAYLAFGPLRLLDDSLSEQKRLLHLRLDSLSSTADSEKDFAIPPVDDHPSHDDPLIDNLPPLPLAIWRAQKIKTKLSFTRLVLSPSTIRLLVPPLSRPSEPISPFQNTFLDSSLITPRISVSEDTADYDINVPSPVFSLNCTPAEPLPATSTSAHLLHDNVQCSFYTFTIRTILDGRIRPARNTPAAYVMSQFRHACHIHDKKLVHTPSPPPCPPFTLPCNRVSKRHADGFYKDVTSRRLGVSYRKSYAFHHVLEDDSGSLSARTLISYSAHKSISHPTKKQLARQVRHKDLLSDRSKFSRHVVHPDLLDSSMWMATKDPAIVIPPTSYNLTMSTTDYSIVQNIRNLVSSRPDVSFCLKERSHQSSVVFVSSKFTGSIQKVVLNPSSAVASHFITDKPTSGPFVGPNCPAIDYQDFKTLGFSRSIIDMVRRILSNSASIYVPSHNFLWLLISKHNTSSVSKKYLRDAIQSVITKSASSSTFSHLWNSETRFSFKLGRVKPCDILMLLDVCAPWFDSHPYPAPSDFQTSWELPADFVHPVFLMR
ncbi:unnamed protein product [Rhizophagus irregularis]|nr:unnamed protein product [Rhizophagus irregularis]